MGVSEVRFRCLEIIQDILAKIVIQVSLYYYKFIINIYQQFYQHILISE